MKDPTQTQEEYDDMSVEAMLDMLRARRKAAAEKTVPQTETVPVKAVAKKTVPVKAVAKKTVPVKAVAKKTVPVKAKTVKPKKENVQVVEEIKQPVVEEVRKVEEVVVPVEDLVAEPVTQSECLFNVEQVNALSDFQIAMAPENFLITLVKYVTVAIVGNLALLGAAVAFF